MLTEDFKGEESNKIAARACVLLPEGNKSIHSLEEYMGLGGLKGWDRARELSPEHLIELVKTSTLRGRGGAGFPVGVKWETVAGSDCLKRFVVCNAAEGEPGTYKDRYLIRKNPYQLIEGILIACYAVNAHRAVIGIKQKFTVAVERLRDVLKEFEQAGIIEKNDIEIFEGPDEYLFGEEKALMEAIDGRGALPRILPPYMLGIRETPHSPNPAAVNNVETLSNLPYILRNGPEQFKAIGANGSGGTFVFTLSGDIKNPGMYELPMGTTLRTLIYDIGGGPSGQHAIKAVFSGVANTVITPDQFDTPLDFDSMKQAGSGLGSGGFIVYDESVCMVQAALIFSRFLSQGSCGQCIPCGQGTQTMTDRLTALEEGRGNSADIEAILAEREAMTSQTRCYLPVQASKLIPSIIEKFPQEFHDHGRQICPSSRHLTLPQISYFDEEYSQFYID